MQNKYPKRLIEVDLPISRISAHARREKSIRQGHLATLHIWWARRPLAACRAVICSSLWPDPVDLAEWSTIGDEIKLEDGITTIRPKIFLQEAVKQMTRWAKDNLGKSSEETFQNLVSLQKNKQALDAPERLRLALLDFIADFSNWDNSTDEEYLQVARSLTKAAFECLGGLKGANPLVIDPFAGGGALPLEAIRVGAEAFASDLNPVAVLLNKIILEYVPKFGTRLADEVDKWGRWICDEAEEQLRELYPLDSEGATPIAYLWARTIISESPGEDIPVEVPLMKTFWLAKNSSRDKALRWVKDKNGHIKTDICKIKYDNGSIQQVRRPVLEIFYPSRPAEVSEGTIKRGSATCPITGYTTPVSSVRGQLKSRRGGANDARLLAVRRNNPKTGEREYRLPDRRDLEAAEKARTLIEDLLKVEDIAGEETPIGGGKGAGRAFSQRNYGMDHFRDLFTPRQLLSLTTFSNLIASLNENEEFKSSVPKDLAEVVQVMLGACLDRLADFNSSLCMLNVVGGRGVVHTFGRQALPTVWDFMETNPFNNVGANWMSGIEACISTIDNEFNKSVMGQTGRFSATTHPLPDDSAVCLFTDPPYYDAVPYADLSDFFIVWLKRSLRNTSIISNFRDLSPKDQECIVDDVKGKDKEFFESTMRDALAEARRVIVPSGIGVIVFAHKSTSGWEAMLNALIDAGWIITGSWPIDTERPGRLRAQKSAALASSIHLVCRPRENFDGSLQETEIGDWRDVISELPQRIHDWMPRLASEGIVGADAIFACLGPALEIYSRYSRVERASGEEVTLQEYLEQVWMAVSNEALSVIFQDADAQVVETEARLTAMWLWTIGAGSEIKKNGNPQDDGKQELEESKEPVRSTGFSLEYDAARKIAQGLGVHLEKTSSVVEVRGKTARLLPVVERTRYLFGKDSELETGRRRRTKNVKQLSLFNELEEAEGVDAGELNTQGPTPGSTVLDRVHQAMILFGAGRGEALRRFLVQEGIGRDDRFWKLAQALSALYPPEIEEKRWVDGVLARKRGLGF